MSKPFRYLLSIFCAAALIYLFCLVGLVLFKSGNDLDVWKNKSPIESNHQEKYNNLTSEILEAIYEIENGQLVFFNKPIDYSTRFYRVRDDDPRILMAHFFKPENETEFLGYNMAESTVAEFLHHNPEQKILKALPLTENAYFYHPAGWMPHLQWVCHSSSECSAVTIFYSLDYKKIIRRQDGITSKRILRRPPKLQRSL